MQSRASKPSNQLSNSFNQSHAASEETKSNLNKSRNNASLVSKILSRGGSQEDVQEAKTLMQQFMTGLREAPDEYDLDFTSDTVGVSSLRKLEKFSPAGIDADLMLASTTDGKVFLIGVYRDEERDFYQEELMLPGSEKIGEIAETRFELIISTLKNHSISVYRSDNLKTPSNTFVVNEGITCLKAIQGGALLITTLSGSLKIYELSKVAN